jgi:DnaJ-class molecular chaperone
VPHVRGLGAGDQFVHVGVRVPSTLSARQRELLQEYGAEEEKTKSKAKA